MTYVRNVRSFPKMRRTFETALVASASRTTGIEGAITILVSAMRVSGNGELFF